MQNIPRERFSSAFAVFFATLGSAVGLGNIWKFPYMTGKFGGGAFLLVYLISILLVALPVMVSEFVIGRRSRKNAVHAFDSIAPGTKWKYVGILGVVSAYLIMLFYASVAGWVYAYVGKAMMGKFANVTAESAAEQFNTLVSSPVTPIIWLLIVIVVITAVLIKGVQKGIERISKTLIPLFFILLMVCVVRAVTLPGVWKGLDFLFDVNFSLLTPAVILSALGLAFFKLSLGLGCMITYSSYYTGNDKLIGTSVRVAVTDIVVSMLAGMAIFPAVFSFGLEPQGGPGLLFITIPLVFSKIPFGSVLLAVFFFLGAIVSTTAMISMVEVPVAYVQEKFGIKRWIAVVANTALMFVIGILSALSATPDGLLGEVKILGFTFFDLFDFLSSNVALPIGGFFIVLFIGWRIKRDVFFSEVSNGGKLSNRIPALILYYLIKYVAPVCLVVVFLNSIGVIKF